MKNMCKKAIYLEDAIEEINKIYNRIELIRERYPTSLLNEYAICLAEEWDVIEALKSLSSITELKQKNGQWIEHEWAEEYDGRLISNYECSECKSWEQERTNYCPNCGAKMMEEKGETDGKA